MCGSISKFIVSILTIVLMTIPPAFSVDPLRAQEDYPPEVGGTTGGDEGADLSLGDLNTLDAQLILAVDYTRFTGEDMNKTYGGIPLVSAIVTFRISPYWRLFISGGYGQTTGDPFYGSPAFVVEDQTEIKYSPWQLGLKYDLARNTKVRFYAGLGVEFAWMEETVPLVGENGEITDTSSSGFNTGYVWILGPEFVLGQGGQALGLEVGWGGSKGSVTTKGHSHDLDMTGYRGRIYFVFPL